MELVFEIRLIHFNPPRFRPALASIRPTVAPRPQVIFQIIRAVLCKDTDTRALARFVEVREGGGTIRITLPVENLQQRKTVIDRTMAIVEKAGLVDQVTKLGALVASL